MWDKDILRDDFLGAFSQVLSNTFTDNHSGDVVNVKETLMPREGKKDKNVQGKLMVDLQLMDESVTSNRRMTIEESRTDIGEGCTQQPIAHEQQPAVATAQNADDDTNRTVMRAVVDVVADGRRLLSLTICRATWLAAADRTGNSDPYVIINLEVTNCMFALVYVWQEQSTGATKEPLFFMCGRGTSPSAQQSRKRR